MSEPSRPLATEEVSLAARFWRYYTTCRNKDGTYHHIGSTSRWRAFKFAVDMTWWSIRHGQPD